MATWKELERENNFWAAQIRFIGIETFGSKELYNKFIDNLCDGVVEQDYQEVISKLNFVYNNEDELIDEEVQIFLKERTKTVKFNRRQF